MALRGNVQKARATAMVARGTAQIPCNLGYDGVRWEEE